MRFSTRDKYLLQKEEEAHLSLSPSLLITLSDCLTVWQFACISVWLSIHSKCCCFISAIISRALVYYTYPAKYEYDINLIILVSAAGTRCLLTLPTYMRHSDDDYIRLKLDWQLIIACVASIAHLTYSNLVYFDRSFAIPIEIA